MMKHRFLTVLLLLTISFSSAQQQSTTIQDPNFEYYLETHAADGTIVSVGDSNSMGDGDVDNMSVPTFKISNVLLLNVNNLNISDLTGIKDFVSLETLICYSNNLFNIDDVSSLTNLSSLICSSNFLTSLDVSKNTNLITLNCSDNQIKNLVLTNNTSLISLLCSTNQLTELNVNVNRDLTTLSLSNNRIQGELNVSNNTNLESLFCASNFIEVLDITGNRLLKSIDISNNLFTTINVSNRNNAAIELFKSEDNDDLYCIQIDSGFQPNTNWSKDNWAYFSETPCTNTYTYVPDDAFELSIEGTGSNLDNFVLTADVASMTTLDVSGLNIKDLTGIEDFIALVSLNCSNNILPSIDLSNNLNLEVLNCASQIPYVDPNDATNNYTFDSLNVKENTALVTLDCSSNYLSNLDLNIALESLICSENQLSDLVLNSNIALKNLDCSNNQIAFLDLSLNPQLTSLLCYNNELSSLNIKNSTNNPNLVSLDTTNNASLFCISVDDKVFADARPTTVWKKDAQASYVLSCGTYVPDDNFENYLETHDIDGNLLLPPYNNSLGDGMPNNNFVDTAKISTVIVLNISGLGISDLTGIEGFIALENLNCSNNSLTALDFTSNTTLTSLQCNNNALSILDVRNGSNNPQLVTFDARNNPDLYCIGVDDSDYSSTSTGWNADLPEIYNVDCDNRYTLIPDTNFEQALIDLGLDSGALDGQVLTANIEFLTSLNVNNRNIDSLIGIKDFKFLQRLECIDNYLYDLDVSGMAKLEELYCSSNYFTTTNTANPVEGILNISDSANLKILYCGSNNLKDLNMSSNDKLKILNCSDNDIEDLNMSSNDKLEILNCSNNNLSELIVDSNIALESLNCDSNKITSLLLPTNANNVDLKDLSCSYNELEALEVNNFVSLQNLYCRSNMLNILDLTSNSALINLDFSYNNILAIDLVNNPSLLNLWVSENQLTELVLANNTLLENLNCANNNLENTLDIRNQTKLIDLNASSNNLSGITLSSDLNQLKTFNISGNLIEGSLDLSTIGTGSCQNANVFCPASITINISNNLLEYVNIKNGINAEISNFNATGNPNLNCILVDNVNAIGTTWLKDASTQYNNTDCRYGETYVPDDAFETYLEANGYGNGSMDDYVQTPQVEVLTSLDISSQGVLDLTGIEDFTALEILNVSNNNLSVADLSNNLSLSSLNISATGLSTIDISLNTALTSLDISNNSFSNIDLLTITAIENLNISGNLFTSFDASAIPTLRVFNCDSNQIVNLDLSLNTALVDLSCQNNLLEILNIQNGVNAILLNLNAQNNPTLTCIETDTGSIPTGATWLKDVTTMFLINCHYGETYVPDDAFEQALIDLGYDAGALDDYVLTSKIESLSTLNLTGKGIADLTGIEDFIRLYTLILNDNLLVDIDLTNNLILQNLYASGNTISNLDLSANTALKLLDVSNNNLTLLTLDSNTSLLELNVSVNNLTSLNVDSLINLKILDCSENQLTSLSVTQNSNLNELYCQFNAFTSDLLNLQNGNNASLRIFNAKNNPDLLCVLVDNPTEILTNAGGTYDSWVKDSTANYQTVCIDADNDGVPNTEDNCPSTPFGEAVDLFGCSYLSLPIDNFTILITGETCLNNNDGKINIVTKEYYEYNANLKGEIFDRNYTFTNEIDILNLLAGTYTLCLTTESYPNFERCFDVVIKHPENLDVVIDENIAAKEVSFKLNGSTSYKVSFNGLEFPVSGSDLSLKLENGNNTIKISTDLSCQGVFEKSIYISEDISVYPNPFEDKFNIYKGDNSYVELRVYSPLGELVFYNEINDNSNAVINIDVAHLSSGIYFVLVNTGASVSTFKIVKQ